jgi:hypothetical protein
MMTLQELQAKQAADLAKLEGEHAIARLCPVPPHSVMLTSCGEKSWISYRADSLWSALDIMAKFQPLAFYRFKKTFARYTVESLLTGRDSDMAQDAGPFGALIDVSQGSGYGPTVILAFFVQLGDDIHKVRVSLERDRFGGSGWHSYGAAWVRNPNGRGNRIERGDYVANRTLSGMTDHSTKWGTGSDESAQYSYAIMADDVDGLADLDMHCLPMLENIASAMHGERPEVTSD